MDFGAYRCNTRLRQENAVNESSGHANLTVASHTSVSGAAAKSWNNLWSGCSWGSSSVVRS